MSFTRCSGGCGCGSIRYDLLSDPVTVYACHCTDCQTDTGASFTLSMIVNRESVVLTRGEPVLREFSFPDGRVRRPYRCPECDVALWLTPRRSPDLRNLQPGTLDDTSWLEPAGHIWTRSRQPWVVIPPDALCYQKQADDVQPMIRAWKERSG